MTRLRWRIPFFIAAVILLWAYIQTLLPQTWLIGTSSITRGLIIAIMVWWFRRQDYKFDRVVELLGQVIQRQDQIDTARVIALKELAEKATILEKRQREIAENVAKASGSALDAQTERLERKIQEGTTASKEAQREANHVNQKLEALGLERIATDLDRVESAADRVASKADRVASETDRIASKADVAEAKEKLTEVQKVVNESREILGTMVDDDEREKHS